MKFMIVSFTFRCSPPYYFFIIISRISPSEEPDGNEDPLTVLDKEDNLAPGEDFSCPWKIPDGFNFQEVAPPELDRFLVKH